MLRYINGNQKNFQKKLELILNERKLIQKSKLGTVKNIIKNVRKNGDKALIKYEKKFSKIITKKNSIKFSRKEIQKISLQIDQKLRKSIDIAFNRIKIFHKKVKN